MTGTNPATNRKIARAIRKQVSTALGAEIGPGFVVIRAPSGFPYSIQYGASAYWNPNTLNLVDQLCTAPGDGTGTMSGSSFSTLLASILASSDYVTSTKDAAAEQNNLNAFGTASSTLVTDFESDFGQITSSEIAAMGSVPPTKTQYIADYVAKHFPGRPPRFPASMASFAAAFSNWTALSEEIQRTTAQRADALTLLKTAKAHIRRPDAKNGGLQTTATAWSVAYKGFPDNQTLDAALQNTAHAMTVDVTLEKKPGLSTLQMSLDKHPLSAVADTALAISLTNPVTGDDNSVSQLWSLADKVEMEIHYSGITIVSASADALSADMKTGWFSAQAVNQIATKTGKDVTGLQLKGSTYSVQDLFGAGKRFARVKTFVISQDPTITLHFHGTGQTQLLQAFATGDCARIDLGQIGCFGAKGSDYAVQSSRQSGGVVTVVIGPTTPSGTVDPVNRKAHIIGGIVAFPS